MPTAVEPYTPSLLSPTPWPPRCSAGGRLPSTPAAPGLCSLQSCGEEQTAASRFLRRVKGVSEKCINQGKTCCFRQAAFPQAATEFSQRGAHWWAGATESRIKWVRPGEGADSSPKVGPQYVHQPGVAVLGHRHGQRYRQRRTLWPLPPLAQHLPAGISHFQPPARRTVTPSCFSLSQSLHQLPAEWSHQPLLPGDTTRPHGLTPGPPPEPPA